MTNEVYLHDVNWFVTLTFKPAAREALFSDPSQDHARIALRELSPWMKRLRAVLVKANGTSVRFVAVVEHHKDGTPHVHVILHGSKMTSRHIKGARWPHGFVDMRRCDSDAARYLAKYVAKEAVRVRASNHYGCSAAVGRTQDSDSVLDPVKGRETKVDLQKKTSEAYVLATEMPLDDAIALAAALKELECYGSVPPKEIPWPQQVHAPPTATGPEASGKADGASPAPSDNYSTESVEAANAAGPNAVTADDAPQVATDRATEEHVAVDPPAGPRRSGRTPRADGAGVCVEPSLPKGTGGDVHSLRKMRSVRKPST